MCLLFVSKKTYNNQSGKGFETAFDSRVWKIQTAHLFHQVGVRSLLQLPAFDLA